MEDRQLFVIDMSDGEMAQAIGKGIADALAELGLSTVNRTLMDAVYAVVIAEGDELDVALQRLREEFDAELARHGQTLQELRDRKS